MSGQPVVLVVMDGIGLRDAVEGNAVKQAHKPNLDRLWGEGQTISLGASGSFVGLDDGEQGNSEVGHLALGSGQILPQDVRRVDEWLGLLDQPSQLPNAAAWQEIVARLQNGGTLHFSGIFGRGRVHSDVDHFYAILAQAAKEGIKRVRLHLLTDGKDVPPQSSLEYVDEVEKVFADYNAQGLDYAIADGGGREVIVCDRYYSNISWVEAGYKLWVRGEAKDFNSAREAIEFYRQEDPAQQDQFMPTFVISGSEGTIKDGDALIYFDFRADRAIEIAEVFDSPQGWYQRFEIDDRPDILFVGLMQYDEDRNIPSRYFMSKPDYHHVLAEVLKQAGKRSFVCSESYKYGHVTFYWDGLRAAPFYDETTVDLPATPMPLTDRPWMKSAGITDELVKALESGEYDFLRVNYPNGDMVGHSAELESTILAVEAVDLAMGRVMEACQKAGAVLAVTADHGKAEELIYEDGSPRTAHTTNRVPLTIWNYAGDLRLKSFPQQGIANIAATVAELLGVAPDPSWQPSLIEQK